jgi:hypothetical protein
MPTKTLAMVFRNQSGDIVRISVDNVKDEVTEVDVKAAMGNIIAKNIFESTGGSFITVEGAEIITRSVQTLSVK